MISDNELTKFMGLITSLRKPSKVCMYENDEDVAARISFDLGKQLAADELVLMLKSMSTVTITAKHVYKWIELQNKNKQLAKEDSA